MRAWLASLFSDIAYRLDDGKVPSAPVYAHAPTAGPVAMDPVSAPSVDAYGWPIPDRQRPTWLVPFFAVGICILLLLGLVKVVRMASASHTSVSNAPSTGTQEQAVVKKFEDAYHLDSVKDELGGGSAESASSAASALAPSMPSSGSASLFYLFPRGEAAWTPPAPRTFSPARAGTARFAVADDPVRDLLRPYAELQPIGDAHSGVGNGNGLPQNGGPVWRDGHTGRRP